MSVKLNTIIPWGRSFDEYALMFGLGPEDRAGRILGCGDGPASFNAEATANGYRVISCDPVYGLSGDEIERRVKARYAEVIEQVRAGPDDFVWNHFRDPDDLGRCRLAALERFLADYDAGKAAGRYVQASLPNLPFEDGQFDLALVSHLLFLYSDQLSLEVHRESVDELIRVAREVRIFPIVTLERRLSPHFEAVRRHLLARGFTVDISRVSYEFQRGVNEMMTITR